MLLVLQSLPALFQMLDFLDSLEMQSFANVAGLPYVGEAMQVFVDHRIRSKLLSSSRHKHAGFSYPPLTFV